jgi:hypothetical protein
MARLLLSLLILAVSGWSQTITVTAPAAGAIWKQGETKTIQWTKQGETGANVRITLRIPDETGAALEIAQSAPNTGSFSWTIPDSVVPGTYFIRVRSAVPVQGDSGAFQIQEKSGTVPFPFITVEEPKADARWTRGSTRTIQWKKYGAQPSSVRILLMDTALANIVQVISDSAPNSGSFSWPIPDSVADGTYRVRIASPDGTKHGNSGAFKIASRLIQQHEQPVKQALLQIKVTVPTEGLHFTIGQEFIVAWEAKAAGPYQIDLMGEDGKTLIMPLALTPGKNIGPDKYIEGNIHPEQNTQVTLATGWYKIRVRGNTMGSGLSPRFHITGPKVEVLEQLQGTYHDRHSRRRINEDMDWQPDMQTAFSAPGKARVGGDFRSEKRTSSWVGFIFRSQVVFPIESIDMTGKTLKDAWIYMQETTERTGRIGEACGIEPYPMPTARGWKVYGLTGPWSGPCIETPGYEVGQIPSHVNEHVIHITDLVRGWLDRSKPNHGLIIGSRFEPFPEGSCFLALSWYKVTLNMKFLKDKAS